MRQGHLVEIFRSYQGEGILAGVQQVFVRLGICHMRCSYCDTPESWVGSPNYKVQTEHRELSFPNPATLADAVAHAERLARAARCHSISITGGEPLVQVEFLEELLPALKEATDLPIYLDSSGTLSERLERIAHAVDYFALDFKPASTPGTSAALEDFGRAIRIASRGHLQVKVVVLETSPTEEELGAACELVRSVRADIPVVLTPVTPAGGACRPPDGARVRALREAARRRGIDPLVIPQIHPLVGWR